MLLPSSCDGWNLYNVYHEMTRMGLCSDGRYQLSQLNQQYTFSPTYPSTLCLPAAMTDEELRTVAKFRSKGRIPACCFRYQNNGATIWRAAQPNTG